MLATSFVQLLLDDIVYIPAELVNHIGLQLIGISLVWSSRVGLGRVVRKVPMYKLLCV